MLTIKTFESSSSGNLHLVQSVTKGKTSRLLIECGLPFKKIKRYLDYKMDISGCLLSHCHFDHSKASSEIMRTGINLYTTHSTSVNLKLSGHRLKIIEPGRKFIVDGFTCLPFKTNHDVLGAVGFLIDTGENRILFATDTSSLPYRFSGLSYIMLECNYSDETIKDIDPLHVARIKKTHMSLNDCLIFLERNDLRQVKEIRLIHLSNRNADAEYFKREIQKLTGIPVIIS